MTDEISEGEAERIAAEIERDVQEHPIRSALPTGRARRLTERIGALLGWSEETIDDVMQARREDLDAAARRKEHE